MTDGTQEIIAAFVDDEFVDADALKHALAQPEARDYLVELLALRELVEAQVKEVPNTMTVVGSGFSRTRTWPLATAAAVLLAASALGGFVTGQRLTPASVPADAVAPLVPIEAPAPTTVIRVEPGVDFDDRLGGD